MQNIRDIVNGKLMQHFNGKPVSVTGVVSHMHGNSMSFDMKTTDDVTVKVTMKKPRSGIEGLVEVHGIANGNSIISDDIIVFSKEYEGEFDVAGHNALCDLLNNLSSLWLMA